MYFFLSGLCWHLPGLSELQLETRHLLQVEPDFFVVSTPTKHLACPRFTALPPQSDPSRVEVPQALVLQALAVGFEEVGTSNS